MALWGVFRITKTTPTKTTTMMENNTMKKSGVNGMQSNATKANTTINTKNQKSGKNGRLHHGESVWKQQTCVLHTMAKTDEEEERRRKKDKIRKKK